MIPKHIYIPTLEGGSISNSNGSEEDDEPWDWVGFVPLIFCCLLFVGLLIWICIDYSNAMKLLEDLTEYIKDHPYEAMGVVISLYIVIVLTILPLTPVHLMVAYAYCKVYNSFWIGFAVATAIIFIGCLIGAIIAILLARYIIADYIKTKLNKSKSVGAKKFRIVDKMFVYNGICLVTLLRLMFIPFGIVSYGLGVTAVSLCDYIIGTLAYIIKIALIVIVGCTIWQA